MFRCYEFYNGLVHTGIIVLFCSILCIYLYKCLTYFVGFYKQKACFDVLFYAIMYFSVSSISDW